MMDPYAIATSGVSDNPFLMAICGYSFEVTIFVPPSDTTAGNIANAYVYYQYDNKKRVKIELFLNGQKWEEDYEYEDDIPDYLRDTTDTVIASFMKLRPVSACAKFLGFVINTKTIIKVKKL